MTHTAAAPALAPDPRYWIGGMDATAPRILHTMMRIKDPDAALRFYVDGLGMKLVHRFDLEAKRLTALFLSFDETSVDGFLELAHYWDTATPFSHGTGYGHIAVGAPDLEGALARLEAMGAEVAMRPYKLFETGPTLAMVKDPDGYVVELVQSRVTP